MHIYHQSQWLLLFFIYSFLGWVWETLYVSAKRRQWVNRGFLHGPWLPIYGTGAIIILFLTLPVKQHVVLVYLLGMLGATALEYVTGAGMERLFHVRYWDYSGKPLNVGGHICLTVSLAWGCFSVLLVRLLHPPVERLLLAISVPIADALSLVLAVLFAVDTTKSVQAALDLKALLESMSASSQRLATAEARLKEAVEHLSQSSEPLRRKMRQLEELAAANREQFAAARVQRRESRNEYLLRRLAERRDKKSRVLCALRDKSAAALSAVQTALEQPVPEGERSRLESTRALLLEIQSSVGKAEAEAAARRDRDYQRALSLLYRNPSAVSRHHSAAFQELFALKKGTGAHPAETDETKTD